MQGSCSRSKRVVNTNMVKKKFYEDCESSFKRELNFQQHLASLPEKSNFLRYMKKYDSDKRTIFYDMLSDDVEKIFRSNKDIRLVPILIFSMLKAVKFLHRYKIAHGDIKPQNILYDDIHNHGLYVLIDYDLSCYKTSCNALCTSIFAAPELLLRWNEKISIQDYMKADLWSLGVTFYYAYFLIKDKYNLRENFIFSAEIFDKIKENYRELTPPEEPVKLKQSDILKLPSSKDQVEQIIHTVINNLLRVNPDERDLEGSLKLVEEYIFSFPIPDEEDADFKRFIEN